MDAMADSPIGMAIPLADTDDAWIEGSTTESEAPPINRQARRKAQREKAKAEKRRGQLVASSAGDTRLEAAHDPGPSAQAPVSADPNEGHNHLAPSTEAVSQISNPTHSPTGWMESQLIVPPANLVDSKPDARLEALEYRPLPGEQPQIDVSEICQLLAIADTIPDAERDFATSSGLHASATREKRPQVKEGGLAPLARDRALADPNARLLTKLKLWLMRMVEPRRKSKLTSETTYPVDQLREVQNDLADIQRRIDTILIGVPNEGTGQ